MKRYEIKGGGFTRYFDLIYYNKGKPDEKFTYGRERHDVINEEIRPCGYFVIITSEKMTLHRRLACIRAGMRQRNCSEETNLILGTKVSGYIQVNRYMQRYLFPRATSQADMLACPFGDCREGQIPRSSAALQV